MQPEPSRDPSRGIARASRATVLGGASLLLAATAHLIGGGTLPSSGVLAVTAGAVGMVALVLTGRRRRLGSLVAVLGVEQLGLHLLFGASAAGSCTTMTGSAHATMGAVTSTIDSACVVGSAMPAHTGSAAALAMWLAHALATVATAWLLARGEAWWWRVVAEAAAVSGRRPTDITETGSGRVRAWLAASWAIGPDLGVGEPRAPPARPSPVTLVTG